MKPIHVILAAAVAYLVYRQRKSTLGDPSSSSAWSAVELPTPTPIAASPRTTVFSQPSGVLQLYQTRYSPKEALYVPPYVQGPVDTSPLKVLPKPSVNRTGVLPIYEPGQFDITGKPAPMKPAVPNWAKSAGDYLARKYEELKTDALSQASDVIRGRADRGELTVKEVVAVFDMLIKTAPNDPRIKDVAALVEKFKSVPENDETSRMNLNTFLSGFLKDGPAKVQAMFAAPVTVQSAPEYSGRNQYEIQQQMYARDYAESKLDPENAIGNFKLKGGKLVFEQSSSGVYHEEQNAINQEQLYQEGMDKYAKEVQKKRDRGEATPLPRGQSAPLSTILSPALKETADRMKILGDVDRFKKVWGTGEGAWTGSEPLEMLMPRVQVGMDLALKLPPGTIMQAFTQFVKGAALDTSSSIFKPVLNAMRQYEQTGTTGETVLESQSGLQTQADAKQNMLLTQETWNAFVDHLFTNIIPTAAGRMTGPEMLAVAAGSLKKEQSTQNAQLAKNTKKLQEAAKKLAEQDAKKRQEIAKQLAKQDAKMRQEIAKLKKTAEKLRAERETSRKDPVMAIDYSEMLQGFDDISAIGAMEFGSRRRRSRS
jgi:hypothetical protein